MLTVQTLFRMKNNLKTSLHRVTRRMRPTLLIPGILILLVSACNFPAAKNKQPLNPDIAPTSISSPSAPTTQPVAPKKPANASVLPDDPRAAVEYALRAQPKAFPFSVTTSINAGASTMNTNVEIESAQRILMVENNRSVKLVDGQCYEKTGDGAWEACTDASTGNIAQSAASTLLDASIVDAGIAMIQSVKFIDTETFNGISARVYEYTTSGDQLGVQVDATTRLWVAEATGLPIKAMTTSTAGGNSATYTQLIIYDPTIKVQAP